MFAVFAFCKHLLLMKLLVLPLTEERRSKTIQK
jgi:hypothetical protein